MKPASGNDRDRSQRERITIVGHSGSHPPADTSAASHAELHTGLILANTSSRICDQETDRTVKRLQFFRAENGSTRLTHDQRKLQSLGSAFCARATAALAPNPLTHPARYLRAGRDIKAGDKIIIGSAAAFQVGDPY